MVFYLLSHPEGITDLHHPTSFPQGVVGHFPFPKSLCCSIERVEHAIYINNVSHFRRIERDLSDGHLGASRLRYQSLVGVLWVSCP